MRLLKVRPTWTFVETLYRGCLRRIPISRSVTRAGNRVARRKLVSDAALKRWYQQHIVRCGEDTSSREDDYRRALEHFGGGGFREKLRALRRELAPPSWSAKGRRRKSK